MCQQLEILEKIREKGKVNGYDIDLAEAQAKDYIRMDKKVGKIEKDVASIKKEQSRQGIMLAKQGGQIDLIVKYINSPAEQERKDGIVWNELKSIMKTPMGRIIVLLAIGCIGLAGQRILELFGIIQ